MHKFEKLVSIIIGPFATWISKRHFRIHFSSFAHTIIPRDHHAELVVAGRAASVVVRQRAAARACTQASRSCISASVEGSGRGGARARSIAQVRGAAALQRAGTRLQLLLPQSGGAQEPAAAALQCAAHEGRVRSAFRILFSVVGTGYFAASGAHVCVSVHVHECGCIRSVYMRVRA